MSFVAALLALILVTPALASDEPDELVPGRITVVKTATTFRFTGKPASGSLDLPDPSNDPTVEGGTLVASDTGGGAGTATFALPPGAGWRRIPTNVSKPLKGYRYKGAGSPTDPCRVVLVKQNVVKATCKGSGVTLTTPFSGDVAVVLTVGTDSKRYCATFGGTTVKNTSTITRRKKAPPPAVCGGGGTCACGDITPQLVTFTNGVGSGNCGSITGGTINDIACGGLYFGGGLDAVPLPIIVPDFAQPTKFRVDSCSGTTLNVAATTAADVGSDRSCTSAGCFFGPPLPVPNTLSTPTSTCLYNVTAEDAQGSLACDTGDAMLSLPLLTGVFLTGDLLPNRCQGGSNPGGRCTVATQTVDCPDGGTCQPDNDIQPCPICNPVTNVCNGGMDNGMACVPGSTQSTTGRFPTSHDCRVSTVVKLGDLDVRLDLTTGTDSDTAAPSGTQQRVFCGFCRDADGTGAFQGPPAVACESNAGCAQPFEACEQRNQGAFANGQATMLSATGNPGGPLADFAAHPSTLVSVFCIPPVFNDIIDGQADLPGPGAITLPGSIQLSGTLSASGAFIDAVEALAP